MLQICHEEKEKVYATIRSGHIDAAADLLFHSSRFCDAERRNAS